MNLGQMQQMIQDHGYGADTAAQQLDFINATYREIHGRLRWPFLEAVDQTLNTVAGTNPYNLPMANWRNVDAIRIDQPAQQNFITIDYKDPQELFDLLHADPTTGTPRYWTIYAQQIWFYPAPDAAYRVSIYYIIEPVDLAAPGDVPLIPLPYHDALVAGAICRIAFRERDWIALELWTQKYETLVTRFMEEYRLRQRQTSSEVKRSGYWNTSVSYPASSTGF